MPTPKKVHASYSRRGLALCTSPAQSMKLRLAVTLDEKSVTCKHCIRMIKGGYWKRVLALFS